MLKLQKLHCISFFALCFFKAALLSANHNRDFFHVCYFNRNNSFSSFRVFFSDEENDEDQRGLYYLPAAPEIDDPEETWNPDVSTFLLIFFSYLIFFYTYRENRPCLHETCRIFIPMNIRTNRCVKTLVTCFVYTVSCNMFLVEPRLFCGRCRV